MSQASRTARFVLLLSVIAVSIGLGSAVVNVVDRVAAREVVFHGEIDADEILRSFHPGNPSVLAQPPAGMAYLSAAEGDATVSNANDTELFWWAVQELAPWIFGALVIFWLAPLLKAQQRGEPFQAAVAGRLHRIGVVLLVGLPALALLQYYVATTTGGSGIAPMVEPEWMIGPFQFLPGLVVLVLADIFRRGSALADLERHTV